MKTPANRLKRPTIQPIACVYCELPIRPGEPTVPDAEQPQHQICHDLIHANALALIEAYEVNHGCTAQEACAALFPDANLTPMEWAEKAMLG